MGSIAGNDKIKSIAILSMKSVKIERVVANMTNFFFFSSKLCGSLFLFSYNLLLNA